MSKNFYKQVTNKFTFLWLCLLTFNSLVTFAQSDNGYIYLHVNATDENSSPNFSFNITGPNNYSKTYTLNDLHNGLVLRDIGISNKGVISVTAGISGTSDYEIYQRAPNSSTWTRVGTGTAVRLDGGKDNQFICLNAAQDIYVWDGTTYTKMPGGSAIDVAWDKKNNRIFHSNVAGKVYHKTNLSGTAQWSAEVSGISAKYIATMPDGRLLHSSFYYDQL